MTVAPSIGIFGKVATQADFLRVNAAEFLEAGLDRLFEEGVEMLRAERTTLPAQPTSFLLAPPGKANVFVGAFAPSQDSVGRSFPLVAFAALPSKGLGDRWSAWPSRLEGFIAAARTLIAGGGSASAADLALQVRDLSVLLPTAVTSGEETWPAAESLEVLRTAVGAGAAPLAYALRTFGSACDQALKVGPRASSGIITVDAPVPTAATFSLWLEISSRRLVWKDAVPSLMWTDGPAGRLLLTFGSPVGQALAFLANPRHRSPRFWPLKTDVATAIDRAVAALTPAQTTCLEDPQATLGDAATAFA